MIKEDQIIKAETVEPDLGNVDGIEMDKIKLTARKITEIVKKDLGKGITTSQAANLIHLSMNHFFGYINERKFTQA